MTKQNSSRSLIRGFLESAERFPDRTALVVDGESLTYSSLRRLAGRIASAIAENGHTRSPLVAGHTRSPLVAVWAHRSQTAYARSEERRVGKEGRTRGSGERLRK